MRGLPEEWDTQTSIIRQQYYLDTVSLDEVYGMLKTHDLEIQQRKNMKNSKAKSVALNTEVKQSKSKTVENSRRKTQAVKSDTDELSSNPDDDTDANLDGESINSEIIEMVAMTVKGVKEDKIQESSEAKQLP